MEFAPIGPIVNKTFRVTIDAYLLIPDGRCGGSVSSDQLWAHLRARQELEKAISVIDRGIAGWRKYLKAHNEQEDGALTTYSLETGDPIDGDDELA